MIMTWSSLVTPFDVRFKDVLVVHEAIQLLLCDDLISCLPMAFDIVMTNSLICHTHTKQRLGSDIVLHC